MKVTHIIDKNPQGKSPKKRRADSHKWRFLMVKKMFILGVSFIMCLGMLVGCKDSELKIGIYKSEDGLASVTLLEDNKFIFNRNIMSSYHPVGSYGIKKDKLTLHVTDDEEYIFIIKNGQLVFVGVPGAGEVVEAGMVFKLSESDMDD